MDDKVLTGKKILFLAPSFFGYEEQISRKMESMGAQVYSYNVRSVSKAIKKAFLKISPGIFSYKTKVYYDKIFQEVRQIEFDYIFVIKCDMPSKKILEKMRLLYPRAVFCLYLWDSVKNIPGIRKKTEYFDKVYSFDMQDCQKYGYKFRPLFYCDEYQRQNAAGKTYRYSVSFIGTIHADRLKVINKVRQYCRENHRRGYWYCFLQSRFIYWFYLLVKKEFRTVPRTFFRFDKLQPEKIAEIVDSSRVILDVQHPRQTGLTMRTIEMLGMNKKVITTNAEICRYDFYNPNNILIIDREKVRIDDAFFDREYEEIPDEIYRKYSLEFWIREILGV